MYSLLSSSSYSHERNIKVCGKIGGTFINRCPPSPSGDPILTLGSQGLDFILLFEKKLTCLLIKEDMLLANQFSTPTQWEIRNIYIPHVFLFNIQSVS